MPVQRRVLQVTIVDHHPAFLIIPSMGMQQQKVLYFGIDGRLQHLLGSGAILGSGANQFIQQAAAFKRSSKGESIGINGLSIRGSSLREPISDERADWKR